ncbi:Sel1 domain protein repeat-containing protein [Parvibaculum lavamentivorans DS-1]|uniref:Sel1 domain protein repeat-containing protein n=1 Tax=Parvibaculum lavamentivorans (strain DS-1 / DSM 13023 / NCIMB 13966) TaxID=402881 RepID=A7HXF4_PARL1|nr:tetratricopeptide repeat protein [Parvibaculum lavamentivorans]ABS64587.1 Sel1 domain protein repeat-containing protein [Parvibaculum lavamentivorans DS-1]
MRDIGDRSAAAMVPGQRFDTRLFGGLFLLTIFIIAFSAGAWAADKVLADPTKPDPSIEGAPNEESGQDLYTRGFYPQALAEWKRAVEQNKDPGAAFRLGEEHFDAKVVERDVETAIKYYFIGALGGDKRAQMDLASMYDKGWGVPQDLQKAAQWYEAAAKQGLESSQYNIATMYEEGVGVEADKVKAYQYYQLAIQGGFPKFATEAIENLAENMTPAEIKKASIMARDFQPLTREQSAAEVQSFAEVEKAGRAE